MHYLNTYGLAGLLLFGLGGCTLEKNLLTEDDGSTAGETSTSDGAPGTEDPTQATTGIVSGPDATSTGGDETSTGQADSGPSDGCAARMRADCEADPACQAVIGEPESFAGCSAEPQFLGCTDAMPCDAALTTVCRDGTDESFRLSNGCFPPGFTVCEGTGTLCAGGGDCVGLGEAECAAAGCTPIAGAPHVGEEDDICADFANPEFLGCLAGGTSCPPTILTLCKAGTAAPAWDVVSGCYVDGFESCGDGSLPACMP